MLGYTKAETLLLSIPYVIMTQDNSDAIPLELLAIRTMQHSSVFYTGTINAEQLCSPEGRKKIHPDIYQIGENDEGYQRVATSARVKDFGRYIGDDRMSPTSIIINVINAEVTFKPFPGTPNFGRLTIPNNGILYIVDGQHRIEGLRYLYDQTEKGGGKLIFEFPVIVTNMTKYDEALHFAIINRTQKGLKTELVDLTLRKISMTEDPLRAQKLPKIISKDLIWKTVAMSISDQLKKTEIWKDRIQEPNQKKTPLNVTTISTIVTSLAPVVDKFNVSLSQVPIVSDTLDKFWEAVGELCPLATKQNPKSAVLMKSLGVGVMHLLFIDIINIAKDYHNNELDEETFKEILEKGKQYMSDTFWKQASVYGSGKSSVSNVYRLVKDSILESYHDRVPTKRTFFEG